MYAVFFRDAATPGGGSLFNQSRFTGLKASLESMNLASSNVVHITSATNFAASAYSCSRKVVLFIISESTFSKPSSSRKGSVLPLPHRNTMHKEQSMLPTLPTAQKISTHPRLAGISNQLIVPITPNFFNNSHNVMLVEHRSRTITAGHMLEPFAYLANIQSTPHVKRM